MTLPRVGQKAVEIVLGSRYEMVVTAVHSPKEITAAQGDDLKNIYGSLRIYTLRKSGWAEKGPKIRGVSFYLLA